MFDYKFIYIELYFTRRKEMKLFFKGVLTALELVWAVMQDLSEMIMEFLAVIAPFFFLAYFIFFITILTIALAR